MIKVILIDDEIHCLDTLRIQLEAHCPGVRICESCRNAQSGIEAIGIHRPDLVFLDIEMPSKNGFALLEELDSINFAVIFTTGYDQYAIKAIRFSALDYLMKPIDPKELVAAVQKVQLHKGLPAAEQFRMLLSKVHRQEGRFYKVAVPTSDGYELILSKDLLYCEANDNYTHIHLKSKRRIVACRTMKEIEEQLLDFPCFIRVHHSYIVNLNEVTRYVRGEGGHLVMTDNTTINVSRSRKEALLSYFNGMNRPDTSSS